MSSTPADAQLQTDKNVGIFNKMAFLEDIPVVNQATSDDDRPTAGYVLDKIVALTFASGSKCQLLLDYLLYRLSSFSSCRVKLKVLQVMRHCIRDGHVDFRQSLRGKSGPVKEATGYNGPPDPLHGSELYVKVRRAAEELLTLLFDSQAINEESEIVQTAQKPAATMQGMGSSSHAGRYEGFGNVSASKTTLEERLLSSISELKDKLTGTATDQKLWEMRDKLDGGKDDYIPAKLLDDDVNFSEDVQEPKGQTTSTETRFVLKPRKPGRAGGGWDDSDDDDDEVEKGSSFLKSGSLLSQMNPDANEKADDSATQGNEGAAPHFDWSHEEKTVKEFIQGEHVTGLPSTDEIKDFVKQCTYLNSIRIVELLNGVLTDTNSTEQNLMRALLAVEGLFRAETASVGLLSSMLGNTLQSLSDSSSVEPVKWKALKISKTLEKLSELNRDRRSHIYKSNTKSSTQLLFAES